jgi:WD40 repeat protein
VFDSQGQGKRKHGDVQESFLAMGMDNGTITVWDLHRGVVAMTLGKDMQLQPVTDVAFSVSDNTLFSSSLASDVNEWDLEVTKITLVFVLFGQTVMFFNLLSLPEWRHQKAA